VYREFDANLYPGLVLVIPYGILADIKGGRFVAALNLIGYALSSVWILCICVLSSQFSSSHS
jgi:hypothetical protein